LTLPAPKNPANAARLEKNHALIPQTQYSSCSIPLLTSKNKRSTNICFVCFMLF
jgi:hypothetical protein